MNLSQCGESRWRNDITGRKLPRRLKTAASGLPQEAAAAIASRSGS